ncbi:MAG: aspartyl/asparaginyl beta-hydroxylase [Verrucomicrobiaceae bacterium]|nr:aspartyl/asparaginyl beta-hydroxylase [Verrucomicrobiaceae bacterium]
MPISPIKLILLLLFIASAVYVHLRGKVRHKFWRQASDHSTFMAPINAFMYMLSRVPNKPYIDVTQFPDLLPLQQHWQEIRDEAIQLMHGGHVKASSQYNDIGFNSFFKSGWKRFYLKWYDDSHPSAKVLCPKTVALLQQIPGVKAAMFTELPPGSRLVRHRDPYAGSLRYHLGLITPNSDGCYIDVDGERYSWRDGESVMFDETFIHYAENTTQQDRLILFCDIERPLKFRWAESFNRFFGRNVVSAAASPNAESDRTGGINKVFKYLYAVRQVGKRMKAWNRQVYYVVKWLLFGAIFAAIIFL